MKLREGFVSNSSSSSFLIWFPKSIELDKKSLGKELLQFFLYESDIMHERIYTENGEKGKKSLAKAKRICNNIAEYILTAGYNVTDDLKFIRDHATKDLRYYRSAKYRKFWEKLGFHRNQGLTDHELHWECVRTITSRLQNAYAFLVEINNLGGATGIAAKASLIHESFRDDYTVSLGGIGIIDVYSLIYEYRKSKT